jgi:hypothetical protein
MVKANFNPIDIPRKMIATSKWSAPYAAIVHEGATMRNGTEYPARPWALSTAQEFDFYSEYQLSFERSRSLRQAFIDTAENFGEACQNAILDSRWDWPRPTLRQNGQTVTSPRDIVDSKQLFNSYSQEVSEY